MPVGPSSSPKTGTPAPYGHACTNCAKAKCKCLYVQEGRACDRCFRLGKQCQPSVPSRRRNPKKAPVSRTAHLEEKLDDLVSLIRSQATQKISPVKPPLPEHTHSAPGPLATASTTPESGLHQVISSTHDLSESSHTDATTPASGILPFSYDYHISDEDAEERLATFTRTMLPFCPILYIPPQTTARDLRRTCPFLWLTIMGSAERSMRRAHEIGDHIKHVIANRVVVDYQRSIEILQGLLVYLQWPHSHRKEKPFLALWTNMVVAMVQELGFTVVGNGGDSNFTAFSYLKRFWGPKVHGPGCHKEAAKGSNVLVVNNADRTMEERRSALGAYLWCTMISQMFRRENPLRWTAFMEESLRMFLERPEWEGDLILVTQIRCGRITQQITELGIVNAAVGETRMPMSFQQTLHGQLQEIWRSLPLSIAQNEMVLLHLYATEVFVHQLAMDFGSQPTSADFLTRLETLHLCLKAVENWFQVWSRIPATQHIGSNFMVFLQLLHAIVALFRLSTLETVPGWEMTEVKKRMDIMVMLDSIGAKLESCTEAGPILEDDPEPGEESIWARSAKSMRAIKVGLKDEFPYLVSANTNPSMELAGMAGGDPSIPGPAPELQDEFLPSFDDPWLSAMFLPWDSMNF